MSSLALAVPVVAQIASAQTATSTDATTSASADATRVRPEFKRPTLQEMIDNDTKLLENVDTVVASLKTATQAHKNALTAAQSLTGTAQTDAIKKAQEEFHAAMEATMKASGIKGFPMFGGPHGGPGRGGMMKMKFDLATKLGMTETELKAAIDSGKTIEQIATEKGVTLPTPPMGGRGHGMMMRGQQAPAATAQ
jgi:hypothetical protein